MADSIRWGVLATGSIAKQFVKGLKVSKTGVLQAVGSRTLERAQEFTAEFGGIPHGSYEGILANPEVDAVYIATPHASHAEWTIKAAAAGKGVLCEKPFTLNLKEAEEALTQVRRHGVFFMEAFMYRCAPQTRKLAEFLDQKVIGEIKSINAEFSFHSSHEWNNFRTTNQGGGGGLMDVGTYCVSLARMVAGCEPVDANYSAHIGSKGYDEYGNGSLKFQNGVTAAFGCGIHLTMQNDARIYGTEGHIHIESPWKTSAGAKMTVSKSGTDPEVFDLGVSNDELYAIEADTVAQYWEDKQVPFLTPDDTLNQMRTLDRLRASAGLHFEGEPNS